MVAGQGGLKDGAAVRILDPLDDAASAGVAIQQQVAG